MEVDLGIQPSLRHKMLLSVKLSVNLIDPQASVERSFRHHR